jgi:hypothetical protein
MDAQHDFNRRRTAVKRTIIMALGVLLALALAMPMALAQVEQDGNKTGKAAKLAEAWTLWAYSRHAAELPTIGEDPEYSDEQCDGTPLSTTRTNTWFLAGTEGGSAEETVRTCTVPAETQLFFPVVSSTFFITEPEENKQIARDFVKNFIRAVEEDPDLSIVVTVDGEEISSDQIVRAKTSFFPLFFPEDNIFAGSDVEAGTYQTISNGLWVTLPPLPPGEHTIHFELSAPNVDRNPAKPGPEGVFQNNTYILTVVS